MIAAPCRAGITGVVLAGGLGRRMGADRDGDDKGLRPFRGRPMVEHVIERLAPQVGALAINANRNPVAWRAYGLPVFPDRIDGFAGPLAGLQAAMHEVDTPWIVTAPCDSPFLPTDLVERLWRACRDGQRRIAVARTGDQPHPVFMLVDRSLRPELDAFLAGGRRRIDAWSTPLGAIEVPFEDETAFRNINTLEDIARWADTSVDDAGTSR